MKFIIYFFCYQDLYSKNIPIKSQDNNIITFKEYF